MLKNSDYIYNNIVISDENVTTKNYCKKAQVGVDLSVKTIYSIEEAGIVLKSKTYVPEYKEIPSEIQSVKNRSISFDGWALKKGSYIIELNEGVRLGPNDTCYIIMRSSLNRSGATICSALWDPQFTTENSGVINTITLRLNVDVPLFYLEKNARVAQIVCWESEDTEGYNGQFQGGLKQSNLVRGSK